jgi:hypothetical protein
MVAAIFIEESSPNGALVSSTSLASGKALHQLARLPNQQSDASGCACAGHARTQWIAPRFLFRLFRGILHRCLCIRVARLCRNQPAHGNTLDSYQRLYIRLLLRPVLSRARLVARRALRHRLTRKLRLAGEDLAAGNFHVCVLNTHHLIRIGPLLQQRLRPGRDRVSGRYRNQARRVSLGSPIPWAGQRAEA